MNNRKSIHYRMLNNLKKYANINFIGKGGLPTVCSFGIKLNVWKNFEGESEFLWLNLFAGKSCLRLFFRQIVMKNYKILKLETGNRGL